MNASYRSNYSEYKTEDVPMQVDPLNESNLLTSTLLGWGVTKVETSCLF